MWWCIGLAGIGLSLAVGFLWTGHRGAARRLFAVGPWIENLYRNGSHLDFMVINTSLFRRRFLQIRKYVDEGGSGLQLAFPRVRWSRPYWEQVRAFCVRKGVAYLIEREDPSVPIDFLYVDFGSDWASAATFLTELVGELFSVRENDLVWCNSRLGPPAPEASHGEAH